MIDIANLPAVREQLARDAAALASPAAPTTEPIAGACEQISAPVQSLPGRLYVSAARTRTHTA